MKTENRKASDTYNKQNVLLHKAFAAQGMPYEQHKDVWLSLATEVLGRAVAGLSEMSLSERHKMLMSLARKGVRIFAPAVPANMKGWKKGDPEIETEIRKDDDRQVRMVLGMWAEMGYPEKTLRGLCFKRFKKDDPRWLSDRQLSQLINIVQQKARSMGLGNYYRR
jgi:hypothetical protein